MAQERLQKVLAAAGLGSRRACEVIITQGRVTIDGKVAAELGTKVDVDAQEVRCDGELVRPAKKAYFLINKPKGHVSTNQDERGRPRVIDLLPMHGDRLFTVGRLDADTEGLLIVTNDGDFAQRIAHPRFGVDKTYRALVRGAMANGAKQDLLAGVWIAGFRCEASWVKILKRGTGESTVEITIHEGRNREVRRMLAKVGHPVIHLRRVRIGPLEDAALRLGQVRRLTAEEVQSLLSASKVTPRKPHPVARSRKDYRKAPR
jgi:23S rRNA pseudouridine2605 synthase